MRDYLVIGLILFGAVTALARPYVGVLFWCWVSYMNPHRLTWGPAYDFPAAMVVGAATLLGLLFTRDRAKIPFELQTVLLMILWLYFVITTYASLYPVQAWHRFNNVTKILLMTFVTMSLVNTRQRLRGVLLVIALSVGFFGLKGGIFSLRYGGADRIYGPPGSFLEDNNDFALATVMVLPILFYLAKETKERWIRWGIGITGLLSIVSVVFTYSRGGFIGLAASTSVALLKSKKKFLAVILLLVVVSLAFFLVPQQWFDRMQSIGDQKDESALGRINAWMFAYNLASSRFLGGGFDTFYPDIFARYAPNPMDFHAAHSIYFEMLGEQGFLGLGLFLTILFSTIFTLQGIRRRYAKWPDMHWAADYADMLQIALAGYMTSGAFLGRANFDLYYHLVAATVILKSIARRDAQQLIANAEAEAAEGEAADAEAAGLVGPGGPAPAGAPV
jgi:probable O-glycosylation ligase (exosortase A-associated)